MALVLNGDAVIRCSHGGTVRAVASQQALKLDGKPALVLADLLAATISDCPNRDPRAGLLPCLLITSVIAGSATKLKAGGQPVVLDSAQGVTSSTPPGTFSVSSAGQTKVSAS
jgi:hypothetical protein